MLRHTVKPGITGWAQVNGWRGETAELVKMEERVPALNMEYIGIRNLLLDLRDHLPDGLLTQEKPEAYYLVGMTHSI